MHYFDPYVANFTHGNVSMTGEKELTAHLIEKADLVMITTSHTNVDYSFVQQHARFIFDTKNATKNVAEKSNIEVL